MAEQAGREAMRFYEGWASVVLKSDSSPLTDADRASHDLLMQFLPDLIPRRNSPRARKTKHMCFVISTVFRPRVALRWFQDPSG